jgi:protein dithiol oxidoreductase (disulfide-forming)
MPIKSLSRRHLITAALSSPFAWMLSQASAQSRAEPREGDEYQRLDRPQPTNAPGKIEVLDFFWYGCPHCYHLLPAIESWGSHKPSDVVLRHVPVDFGDPRREPHTRLFCTLQALDRVEEFHTKIFDAFHRDHRRLNTDEEIADFMAANGIARDKWLNTYRSFSVANMTAKARASFQAYGIDGTPTIAVDGRFLTSPTMQKEASDPTRATISTLDYLVEKVRRERHRHG